MEFLPFEKGVYVYAFHFTAPNGKGVSSANLIISVDEDGNVSRNFREE